VTTVTASRKAFGIDKNWAVEVTIFEFGFIFQEV
jgi:hypothetical protein